MSWDTKRMDEKKRNWLFRKLPCGRLIKLNVDVFYELQNNCISFSEKGKRPRPVLFLSSGGEPIKTIPLARYIMKTPKGSIADHRDRDIFDNRRENLRNVSARQSALNRRYSNRPTDYLGVSFMRSSKYAFRYKAQYLPKKGKRLSLSIPASPAGAVLAAFAHDKFVLQADEEAYAPLNFPKLKEEPFRSNLLKTDLRELREKGYEEIKKEFFEKEDI